MPTKMVVSVSFHEAEIGGGGLNLPLLCSLPLKSTQVEPSDTKIDAVTDTAWKTKINKAVVARSIADAAQSLTFLSKLCNLLIPQI